MDPRLFRLASGVVAAVGVAALTSGVAAGQASRPAIAQPVARPAASLVRRTAIRISRHLRPGDANAARTARERRRPPDADAGRGHAPRKSGEGHRRAHGAAEQSESHSSSAWRRRIDRSRRQCRRLQLFLARSRRPGDENRRPISDIDRRRSARWTRAADHSRSAAAQSRAPGDTHVGRGGEIQAPSAPAHSTIQSSVRSASGAFSDSARPRARRLSRTTSTTICIRSCRRRTR